MRTLAAALVTCLLAGAAGSVEPAVRVAIFYYPWYGTAAADGAFLHWNQNGHRPPGSIASAFYPARGVYSSSDARVVAAHMAEIKAAGVDQVVTSWWGRGSFEDERLGLVLAYARSAALDVAVHVEPYPGRTPRLLAGDIHYLRRLGVRDFYIYAPGDAAAGEWAALNEGLADVRLFAQTALAGFASAGGFDGLYTYDVVGLGGRAFARLCAQARRKGLLCAPSVGPGYDARRASGDPRVKPRRGGATYDAMWQAALRAAPDLVTITSYNEWHEGTQIEPARARRAADRVYSGYEGAWGCRGRDAERAYLDRTAFWVDRLAAGGRGYFAPETNTSAAQPKTRAANTSVSATPRSDGWARSTCASRRVSSPSAAAPSSEP